MALGNSARARILDRIRKAPVLSNADIEGVTVSLGQIYLPISEPLERFLAECEANLTQVKVTSDRSHSSEVLRGLVSELTEGTIYVQDHPTLRSFAESFAGHELTWSSAGRAPESCLATVTLCEGLVAQTGSIVTSSRMGGRGGSVIAPVHIVYATSDQLVPDITTALRDALKSGLKDASFFGLITGSSRTADIEKILVQGAHGPRKVALVLEIRQGS